MVRSMTGTEKRGRGRPRVDAQSIHLRLPPAELARLDAWIATQPQPRPSRPEAIRRLLDRALSGEGDG